MNSLRYQAFCLAALFGFTIPLFSQQANTIAPQKKQIRADRQLIDS